MASPSGAGSPENGRAATHAADRRIGPEHVAELLAVADAASMALLVLEAAARSAREDLDSVKRSVDAIEQQKRAARGAANALDEAGARAAEHLRAVDRLTEAASRSVGAALAESGAHASEGALEELDSWADLSRLESEGLHQYRRDRWDLANALESLNDTTTKVLTTYGRARGGGEEAAAAHRAAGRPDVEPHRGARGAG